MSQEDSNNYGAGQVPDANGGGTPAASPDAVPGQWQPGPAVPPPQPDQATVQQAAVAAPQPAQAYPPPAAAPPPHGVAGPPYNAAQPGYAAPTNGRPAGQPGKRLWHKKWWTIPKVVVVGVIAVLLAGAGGGAIGYSIGDNNAPHHEFSQFQQYRNGHGRPGNGTLPGQNGSGGSGSGTGLGTSNNP